MQEQSKFIFEQIYCKIEGKFGVTKMEIRLRQELMVKELKVGVAVSATVVIRIVLALAPAALARIQA